MQWFVENPDYLLNELFIGADSYSGISAPIVVKQIIDGNFMILLLETKFFHTLIATKFKKDVTHKFLELVWLKIFQIMMLELRHA